MFKRYFLFLVVASGVIRAGEFPVTFEVENKTRSLIIFADLIERSRQEIAPRETKKVVFDGEVSLLSIPIKVGLSVYRFWVEAGVNGSVIYQERVGEDERYIASMAPSYLSCLKYYVDQDGTLKQDLSRLVLTEQ